MGSDFRDVPEPFRYSRAHSWPQPSPGSPPPPLQPSPPRGRLVALVAGAVALGLLLSVIVVVAFFGKDEPKAVVGPPPPSPTLLASLLPEPSERAVPQGGLPRPTVSKTTPTPTKPSTPASSGPPAVTRPLPEYLLTAGDLGGVRPGTWGVTSERLDKLKPVRHPLMACTGSVDFDGHLARSFHVPAAGGGFVKVGPGIGQRIRKYDPGAAAARVQHFRDIVARCPTRRRTGYTDRWSIVRDSRTVTGDVMIVRRQPQPKVPQGTNDFGTDYLVLRNRDVLELVDFRVVGAAPDTAQSEVLMGKLTGKLCGGPAC